VSVRPPARPAPQHWLPETDAETARRYGIAGAREIGWTLQHIVAARAPVTLHRATDHHSFLVAHLLAHAPAFLRFELLDATARDHALLAADRLVAVALIDRIKLQFDACEPRLLHEGGFMQLRCAFPRRIVRIQRREAFRVRPPERHPVVCVLRSADGTERHLRVHDISADGLALTVPGSEPALSPGEIWRHCRLEIEGLPPIPCDIEIRTLGNAARGSVRVGCGFHRPRPESQRAIQRYVIDVQRGRVPALLPVTPACS
jgi:c-di-GMP-binding flagellar brake protein YcgR